MKRVLHVITGLGVGGAEMMLCKLLTAQTARSVQSEEEAVSSAVISLTGEGALAGQIRALGVPVFCLNLKKPWTVLADLWRLVSFVRMFRCSLIQTWMYHADFFGVLFGIFLRVPFVWNLRQSNLSPGHTKRTTMAVVRLCARLSSRAPAAIICGSMAAKVAHETVGYASGKMRIIPNGFDIDRFKPDPAAAASLRHELGFADHVPLVGIVARFDPQKDHRNFLRAASMVASALPEACFLLAGTGITADNPHLREWLDASGVADSCRLLGPRDDVPALMAALDVAVSSSSGEGFPNVVGEAMACGTVCVVTDAGDSALLVGDTGFVVPTSDSSALAGAISRVLQMTPQERQQLGLRARQRIIDHFSISAVATLYEQTYETILA